MKADTPSPLRVPLEEMGRALSIPIVRKGWDTEILVVQSDEGLRCYVNRCPHLPLTLDIGTGDFFTKRGNELLCSNHGARFRPEDGMCTWGPCEGIALQPVPFKTLGSELEIDLSEVDKDRPSRAEVLGEEV